MNNAGTRDNQAPRPDDRALDPGAVAAECRRLRAEIEQIASYIPSTLVRHQLDQPRPGHVSGAHWHGTVLFADLSGFTALSEQLSALGKQGAEEISAIINRLFGALVDEILRYQGVLLKFGGDALTAFFDAAVLGAAHAALASRAALALQERMQAFCTLETRAGVFRLELRIGVHSGQVFAAQVGDVDHVELVVTGRVVNRVALAQETAAAGEVVVSGATLALLERAATAPRQNDFYLLASLPGVAAPPPARPWRLAAGPGDIAELTALRARVAALRPYLARNLPRRFLEAAGTAESGEFRPVTVLFANFFAFTSVLDLLDDDADTAAAALNAYYRRAQAVVHRYDGIVNKVDLATYGDKLMALFGAPVAHENDPECAVRAALDLRAALDEANAEIKQLLHMTEGGGRSTERSSASVFDPPSSVYLTQRIGINTGVVFAGQVGSEQRREYTVMGQHVNLAARLMSAADAGAIVLSSATGQQVERYIDVRPLPPVKLKGIADPVPVAEALRPREAAQLGRRGPSRPAFVSRADEIERLLAAGTTALSGQGRIVALVGEAGVGKSRLIEEALQQLVQRSARPSGGVPAFFPYSVECQRYEQSAPYALVRAILRQLLLLDTLDHASEAAQAAIYERVAALAPEQARFTPLLADVAGLPIADTPLTAALTPEQRHARAQELVAALLLAAARRQPIVLIADDLHWVDASSLELIDRLARQLPAAPLLLLLGYRDDPQIAEPWAALDHCERLLIGELSPEGSTALVQALLDGPPPAQLAGLIDKTQGNPFFIEELVRHMIELGALRRDDDGWRLARDVDERAVPGSIEGVIIARLDRLEERSREILQVASVVGRRFPFHVLTGLLQRADDLQQRLGQLTEADLILLEEIERELAYLFKHALTRDVAYEAILYARRRDLHLRVARQIEQLYDERIEDQLGVLARHYLLAEEWLPALDYHLRAGRQAQARYANREAIAFLEQALQIADRRLQSTQPQSTIRNLQSAIVEIHERLGVVHALIGQYDAALPRYQAALELLGRQAGARVDEQVRLQHHVARVYEKRAEFETAFEWVEQALALAGDTASSEVARCLLLGAGLHRRQGRYGQALEWGQRALAMSERLGDTRNQAHALKLLGGAYFNLGDNMEAFDLLDRCRALYEQAQDLAGLADAHNDLAVICYELGRLAQARENYEAGARIKESIGDIYGQALIANNLGNLLKLQGKLDEAIAQFDRSLTIFEQLGSRYASATLHMNLGATELLHGELERADAHLSRSAELFEQAGAEDFLPELERYIADLHLRRGDLARARLACELSLTTAARLAARAEEGISRRSLAQILVLDANLPEAWHELQQSLLILREVGSPHEIARTLVAIAALAPSLDRRAEGQAALDGALPALRELGAQRDLDEALVVALQHGYRY